MLSALKVIDPTDNDMTGARILANKPVAVSWGQDTDRSLLHRPGARHRFHRSTRSTSSSSTPP